MELRTKPGHISELLAQFNQLSTLPATPENVANKLAALTEAATYCMKFNTQVRQAQRVASFLGDVMADKRQEETVHMVASLAFQALLNHIRPVEKFADKPLRQTRRWNMGTPAQRVHAEAMSKATALHVRAANMRDELASSNERRPQPSGRLLSKAAIPHKQTAPSQGGPDSPQKAHKAWRRGASLGKKPESGG